MLRVAHHTMCAAKLSATAGARSPKGEPMTEWNFADVYEAVARRVPDRPCLVHGERTITWSQLDARADALAADMIAAGLSQQSKVAAYLYNCPEYIETYVAAFKGGFVPVNTNYRYGHDEIVYL